ncbi:MAG: acyltransferase, partial [Zoogloeaceae bacterium]|nr:acyltransferase [Zoogloeaceae bacterium]
QFARLPFKLNARLSSNFLSGLGMALLTIAMVNTSTEHFPGIKALIPVVGTLCLIAAGSGAWLNRKLFSWRPVVGIGLISYPLYLWHWPLLAYGYIMAGETLPPRGYRIAMVFIALALATLTYWAVERPIRFGKNARKLKMIALIAFMITLGITGGIVYQQKVKNLPENYRDILFRDEACDVIADGYCKYHDAKGKATVLVVGDSHAAMAYERIAIHNEKNGVNTLLLGHSIEFNPVNGKLANLDYVSRLFYAVQSDTKIKKVFIFTRGMYYIDSRGKEFFVQKTQASIDNLLQMGKEVYLVADNPDLPFNIRSIFSIQPLLLMNRKKAALYKTGVLTHQKVYLQALQELKGAKILYTLDAFCPENECLLFNENGLPLYYDYNHISIHAGGEFLVQRVLAPYLDE